MLKNIFLTLLRISSALIMCLCITPYSLAEDLINQTANQSLPNITNQTADVSKDKSNNQEEIKSFFKDADYEHFAPEKSYQFIDPTYLEKS